MKVKPQEDRADIISSSGVKASNTAVTISNTAAAFDILSSQLYSDGKLAVVRELLSNAIDVHSRRDKYLDLPIEEELPNVVKREYLAPKGTKIEVYLPTAIQPDLIIKDFGIGIDFENLVKMYLTYFNSDKGESNDEIGGFGLGSKSPFAYSDSFTITSRFNGNVRTFVVSKDSDGKPAVNEFYNDSIGDTSTEEMNGLSIQIPVKNNEDSEQFKDNIKFITYPFGVKTLFSFPENSDMQEWADETVDIKKESKVFHIDTERGVIDLDFYEKGWLLHLRDTEEIVDDWFSYTNRVSGDFYRGDFISDIGGIRYSFKGQKTNNLSSTLLSYLKIKFPIGTISVTPSREQLKIREGDSEFIEEVITKASEKIFRYLSLSSTLKSCGILGDLDKRRKYSFKELQESYEMSRNYFFNIFDHNTDDSLPSLKTSAINIILNNLCPEMNEMLFITKEGLANSYRTDEDTGFFLPSEDDTWVKCVDLTPPPKGSLIFTHSNKRYILDSSTREFRLCPYKSLGFYRKEKDKISYPVDICSLQISRLFKGTSSWGNDFVTTASEILSCSNNFSITKANSNNYSMLSLVKERKNSSTIIILDDVDNKVSLKTRRWQSLKDSQPNIDWSRVYDTNVFVIPCKEVFITLKKIFSNSTITWLDLSSFEPKVNAVVKKDTREKRLYVSTKAFFTFTTKEELNVGVTKITKSLKDKEILIVETTNNIVSDYKITELLNKFNTLINKNKFVFLCPKTYINFVTRNLETPFKVVDTYEDMKESLKGNSELNKQFLRKYAKVLIEISEGKSLPKEILPEDYLSVLSRLNLSPLALTDICEFFLKKDDTIRISPYIFTDWYDSKFRGSSRAICNFFHEDIVDKKSKSVVNTLDSLKTNVAYKLKEPMKALIIIESLLKDNPVWRYIFNQKTWMNDKELVKVIVSEYNKEYIKLYKKK